jgi:hypothetical protein
MTPHLTTGDSEDDSTRFNYVRDQSGSDTSSNTSSDSESSQGVPRDTDPFADTDAKEWRASDKLQEIFSVGPGSVFTKSLSLEKRKRLLRRLELHRKPSGYCRVPRVNRELAEALTPTVARGDKALATLQRNTLDAIIVGEALLLDKTRDSTLLVKGLLQVLLANLGYMTHQRREAIMKMFKLDSSVFLNDDDTQVDAGQSSLFGGNIAKTIAKAVESRAKLAKAGTRPHFQGGGQGSFRRRGHGRTFGHQPDRSYRGHGRGGYQGSSQPRHFGGDSYRPYQRGASRGASSR